MKWDADSRTDFGNRKSKPILDCDLQKNGNDGRNCVPDGWVFPETLIWVSTDKKIIYSIDFRQSSFVWTERHIAILPVSSNKHKRSFILVVGNSVG